MKNIIDRLLELGIDDELISEEKDYLTISLMLGLEFIIYKNKDNYRIVISDQGYWGEDTLLVFKDDIKLERFKSAYHAFTGIKLKNE